MECSNAAGVANGTSFAVGSNMSAAAGVDEVSRWWAAIVAIGAYWLNGDLTAGERMFTIADTFPKQLQATEYVILHTMHSLVLTLSWLNVILKVCVYFPVTHYQEQSTWHLKPENHL